MLRSFHSTLSYCLQASVRLEKIYLPMESVAKEAKCPATILAIATANPANCYHQKDYPDFLFRVTKSEDKTELKDKFKRICKPYLIYKIL